MYINDDICYNKFSDKLGLDMKKVLCAMACIATLASFGMWHAYHEFVPKPIASAVIGEKPGKNQHGQIAIKLPDNLSNDQSRLLSLAYKLAKEDGHKSPEIVQMVLLQETQAGGMKSYRVANPGADAYFGPMQIKLAAARDVLNNYPALWSKYSFHTKTDDEVKANLILNDKFNIEVGSKYLLILSKQYGFSGRKLLNAYNRGPGGVHSVDDGYHYAIGAEAKLASYKGKTR